MSCPTFGCPPKWSQSFPCPLFFVLGIFCLTPFTSIGIVPYCESIGIVAFLLPNHVVIQLQTICNMTQYLKLIGIQ